ncbi:hypothetical protein PVAG01_01645 [Phlyctema vagabunda]|uniref:Uncharacterized protein n=1 Tax=Phlyctema vagabunda TaxID=108571 RepID=A0ABR4PZ22_9HELO
MPSLADPRRFGPYEDDFWRSLFVPAHLHCRKQCRLLVSPLRPRESVQDPASHVNAIAPATHVDSSDVQVLETRMRRYKA